MSYEEAKRRGLEVIEKTMENHQNLQYYATLYIGSAEQEMTFIYDTGSTFLWVPLSNCSDCHTDNLYNEDSSNTFSTSGVEDSITYGKGSVAGIVFTDNVKATTSTSAVNMRKYLFCHH